jgi:hypothetical protein
LKVLEVLSEEELEDSHSKIQQLLVIVHVNGYQESHEIVWLFSADFYVVGFEVVVD